MTKARIAALVLIVVCLPLALVASACAAPVLAEGPEFVDNVPKDSHKVRNKWDMSGEFTAHPGYNWGGMAEGALWTYRLHIKEAMNGDYSVGSIHFMTGDIDVVGHVEATKSPYAYWGGTDVVAAVGTADYNGTTYYFMFLMAERAMWFTLSTTPYDSYWTAGTVWGGGLRAYQLHSWTDIPITLDYKVIHSD